MYTCTPFNSHFPRKLGLTGCPLESPVILTRNIVAGQSELSISLFLK